MSEGGQREVKGKEESIRRQEKPYRGRGRKGKSMWVSALTHLLSFPKIGNPENPSPKLLGETSRPVGTAERWRETVKGKGSPFGPIASS